MRKELYRSKSDKMLGGVCGGLAEYFDISSTLVRLICLALMLIDGVGLIIYIIAWIIIPEEPEDYAKDVKTEVNHEKNFFVGISFILFGGVLLLNNFFPNIFSFSIIFGILFLILGIYLIIKGR
ncbi:PspC domain-containing protein [Marinitoga sp. 38H-ov]|uniref:PspC domain-containing protein n=1 Tax=Marinitoga sp. 38H-ov TaxID=1755814 RepID=UPI0013EC0F6D|nr:PspC domain-containing protein [Marinitoga sp. 38H-ov]KAF2956960.1 hypothetical protein AS160_02950 [Marinitoga sp. 38H-ov]